MIFEVLSSERTKTNYSIELRDRVKGLKSSTVCIKKKFYLRTICLVNKIVFQNGSKGLCRLLEMEYSRNLRKTCKTYWISTFVNFVFHRKMCTGRGTILRERKFNIRSE